MKTKTTILKNSVMMVLIAISTTLNAQIKYRTDGKLTMGDTDPYEFYHQTLFGNGMYFKCKTSNFFQIDVTPAATRLASHYNQVVFYNTKTSTYSSIQVQNVYTYSDARAKTDIKTLNSGLALNTISKLRPVTYRFKEANEYLTRFSAPTNEEIGLLAQEVEAVLPNVVLTDEEGKKLINYTALIPVLIQAIQALQAEVDALKSK